MDWQEKVIFYQIAKIPWKTEKKKKAIRLVLPRLNIIIQKCTRMCGSVPTLHVGSRRAGQKTFFSLFMQSELSCPWEAVWATWLESGMGMVGFVHELTTQVYLFSYMATVVFYWSSSLLGKSKLVLLALGLADAVNTPVLLHAQHIWKKQIIKHL